MEIILVIITITMSIIICILTVLIISYKRKLKSAVNLNNYLKEIICNVDILNKSEGDVCIKEDKNIFVDFNNSYVRMYNPQKNNLVGFIKLLISIKPRKILFYLGDNSPLENYYREPEKHHYINNGGKRRILNGAKEVNLVIYGKLYKLCCLVNKDEILDLVNIISLAINKEEIYLNPKYKYLKREGNIIKYIKNIRKIKTLKNEVLVLDI